MHEQIHDDIVFLSGQWGLCLFLLVCVGVWLSFSFLSYIEL